MKLKLEWDAYISAPDRLLACAKAASRPGIVARGGGQLAVDRSMEPLDKPAIGKAAVVSLTHTSERTKQAKLQRRGAFTIPEGERVCGMDKADLPLPLSLSHCMLLLLLSTGCIAAAGVILAMHTASTPHVSEGKRQVAVYGG